VAAALRRKADACVGVAKALGFVADEVRAETGDAAARELEARWTLQLAETQDREGETCVREAASAESRALRASMRAKYRR
jgi:hypothetical protein